MTTDVDRYGAEGVVGRKVSPQDLCAVVIDLPAGPVACAYAPGHKSLHSWADLPGAKSSRPPGKKGAQRTREASARARGH
jgi:hypothetical protein